MDEESYEDLSTGQTPDDFTGKDWSRNAMASCVDYASSVLLPDWQTKAACAGMGDEMFFGKEELPGKQRHRPTLNMREVREAKAICVQCPVRWKCLEWAINNNEEFGIWGGTTGRERNRLMKAQGIASVHRLMAEVGLDPDE